MSGSSCARVLVQLSIIDTQTFDILAQLLRGEQLVLFIFLVQVLVLFDRLLAAEQHVAYRRHDQKENQHAEQRDHTAGQTGDQNGGVFRTQAEPGDAFFAPTTSLQIPIIGYKAAQYDPEEQGEQCPEHGLKLPVEVRVQSELCP